MATLVSWSFSHLESGLVRLASDAGHVLDMHPTALVQMTAHELLTMLERRAAEQPVTSAATPATYPVAVLHADGTVSGHTQTFLEQPASSEQPSEQPVSGEEQSDAGSAE